MNFTLPDLDVFEIDASLPVPVEVDSFSGVGTTLFNMATAPDGRLFVSNTEARNHVRFEGPGDIASTVRGHTAENRVTIIDGGTVTPFHLNHHIDFDLPFGQQVSGQDKARSIAQPGPMAYINDELWVLPFGSKKIRSTPTRTLSVPAPGSMSPGRATSVWCCPTAGPRASRCRTTAAAPGSTPATGTS